MTANTSLNLKLTEPKLFTDSMLIVSQLLDEATFRLKPNMVELAAMDAAKVAMVVFRISPDYFEEYPVKDATEFTVNMNSLRQVLKRAKKDDTLELRLSKSSLALAFSGRTSRSFTLPLIDNDEKPQQVPDLKFAANVTIPSGQFSEAIEDIKVSSFSAEFAAMPDMLIIESGDNDDIPVKVEMSKSELVVIETESKETVKARYSVGYLTKMLAGSKIAGSVKIMFKHDHPLQVVYRQPGKLNLTFILAPRVEN